MDYPLISEYREAILSAEDNFNELALLRPVLDGHGDPVMSSGNFAVVFKMKDENDGKLYAIKCFIKDQEGRDESYRKIADELEVVSSSYVLPLRYLENELFVDSPQCDREEFSVVVMEWVEGEPLDTYLKRHLNDKYELEMLSYRFNRMSAWLLAQPFAHGDLKPDNILVRRDGSLVLVDYDGMFVPSMKGEKARELGSPDYRHPLRTDADFNEHIDDFSIAVIALSLKAIALNPELKTTSASGESLLLGEKDFQSPAEFVLLKDIQNLTNDADLSMLLGIFYVAWAKNSLEMLSFRLFMTEKPKQPKKLQVKVPQPVEKIDTKCTIKDLEAGIPDEFGVLYSPNGKRLLKCNRAFHLMKYKINPTTEIICDEAFKECKLLQTIDIPNSVTTIGKRTFSGCKSLRSLTIPNLVTHLSNGLFSRCDSLQEVILPNSILSIGVEVFFGCESLQNVNIPDSVTSIGGGTFWGCCSLQSINLPATNSTISNTLFCGCESLQNVNIPDSVTSIGMGAFWRCRSLRSLKLPASVITIDSQAFLECVSLQCITLPNSIVSIGERAFSGCKSLKSVTLPNSITTIGKYAFARCTSLSNLTLSDSIKTINKATFYVCELLHSVDIPNSVSLIGDEAFWGCKSLKNIKFSDSIISIGNSAFSWCKSLQHVVIPENDVHIGNDTFPQNCKIIRKLSKK